MSAAPAVQAAPVPVAAAPFVPVPKPMAGGASVSVPVPAASFAPAPLPPLPVLTAPGLAAGPLGRALGGAYQAIVRAGSADPAAAERAGFMYAEARQRALRGDLAGALAAAGAAQAAALDRTPSLLAPATAQLAPPPEAPPSIVAGAAALPPQLLVARSEIELAERTHPTASLEPAKRRYRAALDAYVSGNALVARREARAAFDFAADVLSRLK